MRVPGTLPGGRIDGPASRQQAACFAARFVGEHAPLGADEPRHWQAIDAKIGADIDCRHAALEPSAQKAQLLFEPTFLLGQDISGDGIKATRNRKRYLV